MGSHRIGHRYDDSVVAIEKNQGTRHLSSHIWLLPMCYLRESVANRIKSTTVEFRAAFS
jgi:hypothetical protein